MNEYFMFKGSVLTTGGSILLVSFALSNIMQNTVAPKIKQIRPIILTSYRPSVMTAVLDYGEIMSKKRLTEKKEQNARLVYSDLSLKQGFKKFLLNLMYIFYNCCYKPALCNK